MEAGNADKQAQATLLPCSGAVSCSVCLEAVADRGERSIAKLKCGHHFHLDCIGSAFNAKGAMQCPNCRHVENGQWLFANGCHPFEDFIVEDWTNDEDLYDGNHTELPFGFRWNPYQGLLSQLSVSLEEVDPPPGAYPDLMGNALYGEHPNASVSARVCPYLTAHAVPRARQFSVPMNNATPSTQPADIGVAYRNGTSGMGDPFGSRALPAVETHQHNWHTAATFSNNNGALNPNDPAAPVSPSERLRLTRRESENLHHPRSGSLVHLGYTSHGPYARTIHGNGPAAMATDFSNSLNHIHGHRGGHLYHPQPAAIPFYSGLITHRRIPRLRDISLISSRRAEQNTATERGRVLGPSAYGFVSRRRHHQDGDTMGWPQDHRFNRWEREGFPPIPRVSADHDSQWRASFRASQNPENISAEPGNYLAQNRIDLERGVQGRSGISMDNPYQHRTASNFPPFP